MKNRIFLKKVFSTIVFTLLLFTFTFGHSGRTDSDGGHMNHKTGKYHYHNGGNGGWWIAVAIVVIALVGSVSKKDK
jgi:hypothetical protein